MTHQQWHPQYGWLDQPVYAPRRHVPPPAAGWTALVGGALMILGVIMPWAVLNAGFVVRSMDGIETADGRISICVGIIAVLGGLLVGLRKAQVWVCWIAAVTSLGVLIFLIGDAMELSGQQYVRIGDGLYLSIAGALFAGLASLTCAIGRVES